MRVGLIGDLEGDRDWAVGVLPALGERGDGETVVRLPGGPPETTIWSLAANRDPGNVRVLDLDTLSDAPQPDSRCVPR
jgi:hypothetical protein